MKSKFFQLLLISSIASLAILSSCDNNSPVADFNVSETDVIKGTVIYFNDSSTNTPTTWYWDFGDGGTKIFENTSHAYDSVGVYTVKLTVSNIDGSDTKIKTDYIRVSLIGTAGAGLTDINGNTYTSVIIGEQEWMGENLNVTTYPNGDAIPLVTDNTAWGDLSYSNFHDAYCYYNNNASGEADIYGALYTYAAAIGYNWQKDNSTINAEGGQGVCPDGWHLPTSEEWDVLDAYFDENAGSKLAGNAELWEDGRLKESSDFGTSGFSALPGSYRSDYDGTFYGLGSNSWWWSATNRNSCNSDCRYINSGSLILSRSAYGKSLGLSVRCVKD